MMITRNRGFSTIAWVAAIAVVAVAGVVAVLVVLVVGCTAAPQVEEFGFEEELVAEREHRRDDVLARVVVPVVVVGTRAGVLHVATQRHPVAGRDRHHRDVRRRARALDLAGDGAGIDHDVEHRTVLRVLLAATQA